MLNRIFTVDIIATDTFRIEKRKVRGEMVAEDGVEPSLPKKQHFECCVSTSSTTRPWLKRIIHEFCRNTAPSYTLNLWGHGIGFVLELNSPLIAFSQIECAQDVPEGLHHGWCKSVVGTWKPHQQTAQSTFNLWLCPQLAGMVFFAHGAAYATWATRMCVVVFGYFSLAT